MSDPIQTTKAGWLTRKLESWADRIEANNRRLRAGNGYLPLPIRWVLDLYWHVWAKRRACK